MLQNTQSNPESDVKTFELTNSKFKELIKNYTGLNKINSDFDTSLMCEDLGLYSINFWSPLVAGDNNIQLFFIVDEKKLNYARIKYEF